MSLDFGSYVETVPEEPPKKKTDWKRKYQQSKKDLEEAKRILDITTTQRSQLEDKLFKLELDHDDLKSQLEIADDMIEALKIGSERLQDREISPLEALHLQTIIHHLHFTANKPGKEVVAHLTGADSGKNFSAALKIFLLEKLVWRFIK